MIVGAKKYDIGGFFSLGRCDTHDCYRCGRESSDYFSLKFSTFYLERYKINSKQTEYACYNS